MEANNKTYRIIFHIDMNCFFASCEIAADPSLKGKPIIIAHDEPLRKSIILTASYEARKFGIYTTMLTRDAIKLCPNVEIVEPNYNLYSECSKKFFDYMYGITKLVEPMSIDEGFFDVTEACNNINPIDLANKIQKDLLDKYSLPCSIGIAPNKFLAKMASDMKKPLGITVLRKREIDKLLWPLPIKDMIGVGKKTAPRLNEIGINTIGDAANYKNIPLLEQTVGKAMASYIIERSHGNSPSELNVENNDDYSSVSNEHTFDFDVNSISVMKDTLKNLLNSVCHRLEKHEYVAKTFGIKIKYNNFQTINRSAGLNEATNDSFIAWHLIETIFDENYDETRYVRLVGVFASRIEKANKKKETYNLFDDLSQIEKENEVKKLLQKINTSIGCESLKIGIKEKGK